MSAPLPPTAAAPREVPWTKGPWRVGPVDDTVVSAPDGSVVAEIDGDYNEPDLWPIMEANARLIAAAPQLVDAAENLLIAIGMGWDLDGATERMRAALLSAGAGR